MSTFFNKYKVFILGFLAAAALAANELLGTGERNTRVLVFAALIAGLSFLAYNLRGQWASIAGLVGTTLATYLTHNVSIAQLVLSLVIALLAIVAPPAKSRGYEHTPTIEGAKAAGEVLAPSSAKMQIL